MSFSSSAGNPMMDCGVVTNEPRRQDNVCDNNGCHSMRRFPARRLRYTCSRAIHEGMQSEVRVNAAQSGISFRMVWPENQTTKASKTAKNLG